MFVETYTLGKTLAVSVTTAAQDVAVNGRSFIIQNNSAADVIVYFKEKNDVAATSTNAWKLIGGTAFPIPLNAYTLSIVGSANANVIIQYLE